uniref:Uncharacterized protein n=1 Tax=Lactuca sativa TaxID=4236 RepID=A0A9R1W5E3_LACSA|nr:hypothetical protein LSAT_V11C300153690 [Lactuca sativa]
MSQLWEDFSKGHLINIATTKLEEDLKTTIFSQDLNSSFSKETNTKIHLDFNNLASKISTKTTYSNHLFDIVKSLATSTQAFQNETKSSIKNLEQQVPQLVNSMRKLEAQTQEKFPSHTEKNLKHNACVVTLISGKNYKGPDQQEDEEEEIAVEQEYEATKEVQKKDRHVESKVKITQSPFPSRLKKHEKKKRKTKILWISLERLRVGPLKKGVIIQLADPSLVHSKGVLVDVLVQVNELIFPSDFYVLDMGDDNSPNSASILLGRPFLKTARMKIHVYDGTLSMEFDGEVINLNIYDIMRYPDDVSAINFIDVIEPLSAKYFEIANHESLALVLHGNMYINATQVLSENYVVDSEVQDMSPHMDQQRKLRYGTQTLKLPVSKSKLFPSVVQAPILELKTLPEHLKLAYLGEKETLPVIISNKLSEKEESELIRILKEYKSVIGWTIADIK